VAIDADVISLSLGGMLSDTVRAAFDDAILEHDVIVVAAAGQTYLGNVASVLSPEDSVIEPARFQNVIAVAGCSVDGRPWDESHRGPNVDITAPCDAVWVAEFDAAAVDEATGQRRTILQAASGTSFAAAITAGAAALWVAHWGGKAALKQRYPRTPLAWVFREILQRTARPVFAGPWDATLFGPGILNLERLLNEPLPPAREVREPPATVANLLTGVEEGVELIAEIYEGFLRLGRDAEDAARAGAVIFGGLLESGLDAAVDALAVGYAAAEEAVGGAAAFLAAGIEAGERIVAAGAEAAEDLADAAEETGEDVTDFFEDVGEAAAEGGEWVADALMSLWP
jgi:hypothetical protein